MKKNKSLIISLSVGELGSGIIRPIDKTDDFQHYVKDMVIKSSIDKLDSDFIELIKFSEDGRSLWTAEEDIWEGLAGEHFYFSKLFGVAIGGYVSEKFLIKINIESFPIVYIEYGMINTQGNFVDVFLSFKGQIF